MLPDFPQYTGGGWWWRSGPLYPPDAEAGRAALLDLNGAEVKAGGQAHAAPVFFEEAAANGEQAIRVDEAVPPRTAHQQVENAVRHRLAVQVGDVPAGAGGRIHPCEQPDDFALRQVVQHT